MIMCNVHAITAGKRPAFTCRLCQAEELVARDLNQAVVFQIAVNPTVVGRRFRTPILKKTGSTYVLPKYSLVNFDLLGCSFVGIGLGSFGAEGQRVFLSGKPKLGKRSAAVVIFSDHG